MVVEYIRYRIPADRSGGFADAYARAAAILDVDEHCLGYEVAQGVEDPENWTVRITWDSVEGHEQGFRRAPQFREFLALVRPYLDDIQEMQHYQPRTTGPDSSR